jgi:hypothetical protein
MFYSEIAYAGKKPYIIAAQFGHGYMFSLITLWKDDVDSS